jgi:hypothetical protein
MIREQAFREDLFYRFNVFPIETAIAGAAGGQSSTSDWRKIAIALKTPPQLNRDRKAIIHSSNRTG